MGVIKPGLKAKCIDMGFRLPKHQGRSLTAFLVARNPLPQGYNLIGVTCPILDRYPQQSLFAWCIHTGTPPIAGLGEVLLKISTHSQQLLTSSLWHSVTFNTCIVAVTPRYFATFATRGA